MADRPPPRNGAFWLFYGTLAALFVLLGVAVLYAAVFIRPTDIKTISETKTTAEATKRAFDATVVGRTPEGFHRNDMREWCQAFAEANRGRGIICPDPYTLPGFYNPPQK